MKSYYEHAGITIYHADCFDVLHDLKGIGAVVTDPPYSSGGAFRGDRSETTVWWKPGIRMQRGQFSLSAEYVIYATNGPAKSDFDGAVQNVFKSEIERDKEHIAQKPESVMRWVMSVVPPGAIVLDPFMGSGTTLRAAKDLGHNCIGVDSDERSCEIAAKRLAQEVLL